MQKIDAVNPSINLQRHVHVAKSKHIRNKNMQAAWNSDHTKHDNKTFNSKIGSLNVVQSIARQALGLAADVKLAEAAVATNFLLTLNESANDMAIKPVLFVLQ